LYVGYKGLQIYLSRTRGLFLIGLRLACPHKHLMKKHAHVIVSYNICLRRELGPVCQNVSEY